MKSEMKKRKAKSKSKIYSNGIRVVLKELKMSQKELSEMTGIDMSHLSKIILGKRACISLPIAFKISTALNKPIEELFTAKKDFVFKSANTEEGD